MALSAINRQILWLFFILLEILVILISIGNLKNLRPLSHHKRASHKDVLVLMQR